MGKRPGERKARKSKKVEDLSVKKAKAVVGGGTPKSTTSERPSESIALSFTKIQTT